MQPTDQISTACEYFQVPNRISGARYQSVMISWVYSRMGQQQVRASPKSASLILRSYLLTRMFWGFRSLWMTRLEWQQSSASNSWQMMLLVCYSVRLLPYMYFFRSQSTYSKMSCSLFSPEDTYLRQTILGWCSYLSSEISLTAVEGSPSSSWSRRMFLMATISLVRRSRALKTTPQVPSPILLSFWYFSESSSTCMLTDTNKYQYQRRSTELNYRG